MFRFVSAAAWAGAAGLAWHLAGQALAFAVLTAAVAWTAGALPAAMAAGSAAGEKARAVEARLNALVPKVPHPQNKPGDAGNTSYTAGNNSYTTSNSSYSMAGGTKVTSDNGSGNDGGGGSSNTSGQIGGAAAHYHAMTHYHVSNVALQDIVNALRDTMSGVVPCLNTLRDSHSELVPAVNEIRATLSGLVPAHNNLLDTLQDSGILR